LPAAASADLLLNFRYTLGGAVVARFKRSALIDIDPGLLQAWMALGKLDVAAHDVYFTIGERVGSLAVYPYSSVFWHYTPPAVALEAWPVQPSAPGASYTTVSHWWGEWMTWEGEVYENAKRTAFLAYLDLPPRTPVALELALYLTSSDEPEKRVLEQHWWRVRVASEVSAGPQQYRAYVRSSRGEFSCAKPSFTRFANAWVSDRTLCYLASGKPAIVQYTGPSQVLPTAEGLFRFSSVEAAVRCLKEAEREYDYHCRAARALAEEFFDARKVATAVLERALA
jgi:hypothetical protein